MFILHHFNVPDKDSINSNFAFFHHKMYDHLLILSILSLLFQAHCAKFAPYEQMIHPPINNISKQDSTNSSVLSLSFIMFWCDLVYIILLLFQLSNLQVNSQKTFDIVVHGILLWASMGFLMPVGILTMRMSSTTNSHHSRHKILFNLHAIFQVFQNDLMIHTIHNLFFEKKIKVKNNKLYDVPLWSYADVIIKH